jgi:hypothetical protein
LLFIQGESDRTAPAHGSLTRAARYPRRSRRSITELKRSMRIGSVMDKKEFTGNGALLFTYQPGYFMWSAFL